MTFALDAEFIELAIELIDEEIEQTNAIWVSIGEPTVADPLKPFEVGKASRTETPVKILFSQDALEDRQLFKYRKETSMREGQVNGYMYAYSEFEPSLKDVVLWQGRELIIQAMDPIQPVDKVILYFIEFGS